MEVIVRDSADVVEDSLKSQLQMTHWECIKFGSTNFRRLLVRFLDGEEVEGL
jgi:hypothetical protein